MPRTLLLGALLLAPVAAAATEVDCANPADQTTLNICAAQTFDRADAELNRRYATLRGKLDANGQRNLVAAERAWIAFRDLECNLRTGYDAVHPENNGTIASMLIGECKTALTRQRIRELAEQIKCPGGDLSCKP